MTDSYQIITRLGLDDLEPRYVALIYSKWLRSMRHGNEWFKAIDSNEYYSKYHTLITLFLRKPETIIKLAVLTDDPDVVLGFAVSRGNILDYVHVHKDQRRQGIARNLAGNPDTYTHLTKHGKLFVNSVIPQAKFNPFI